jgi:Flp pilus assembly protein TadD
MLLAELAQSEGRDWEPLVREALEQEPDNVYVHLQHARLLAQAGRDEEARKARERAAELDPRNAD